MMEEGREPHVPIVMLKLVLATRVEPPGLVRQQHRNTIAPKQFSKLIQAWMSSTQSPPFATK